MDQHLNRTSYHFQWFGNTRYHEPGAEQPLPNRLLHAPSYIATMEMIMHLIALFSFLILMLNPNAYADTTSIRLFVCFVLFCFYQIQQFKRGDKVLVKSAETLVKELQVGHGGWNEAMGSVSFFI